MTAVRLPAAVPRGALLGAAGCLLVAVAGLTWAKWWPYAQRLDVVWATDAYPGTAILEGGGGPSLAAGWDFTVAYARAVWPALVVALLLASAVQALLPRRWLLRAVSAPGRLGTVRAGLVSLPMMMCTCCTAPVAATLRRSGVPLPAALAYWLGNPTLNPAVLAFMAVLLPWQWVATRVVVGALLVFVVTAWVARLAGARDARLPLPAADDLPPFSLRSAPRRFAGSLGRLSITLVPEYLVVVFAVGALHGWLFPFDGSSSAWMVAVAAAAGTLLVTPTAGEIPILQGLAAGGAGAGVLGALLVALPAVSLPSLVMVGKDLGWRATALTGLAVAGTAALAGVMLWAIT